MRQFRIIATYYRIDDPRSWRQESVVIAAPTKKEALCYAERMCEQTVWRSEGPIMRVRYLLGHLQVTKEAE